MVIQKIKEKVLFKVNFFYKKYLGKYNRKDSYPFVSGDSFRKKCNHIFDEIKKCDPTKINNNDFVFVKSDLLKDFFNDVHPRIKNKYNLISHNSDEAINGTYGRYLDDKILNWYAQNVEEKFDPRVKIIPIGLENRWHLKNGRIKNFIDISNNLPKKNILIHASFSKNTHKSRPEILNKIKLIENVTINEAKKNKDYLNVLASSYFNICPRGNGIDTHRIWESLIFETIPIVENNSFTAQLDSLGIPVLILESWDVLGEYSKEDLLEIYFKIKNKKNLKTFSELNYWEKKLEL